MRLITSKLIRTFPHSLLSEISRIFGPEATEKLLTVFAGVTLYIPSTKEIEEATRNLVIYETVNLAKSKTELGRLKTVLCEQFDISRKELAKAYQRMKKQLNESTKISLSDAYISKLEPHHMVRKRRSKRRI